MSDPLQLGIGASAKYNPHLWSAAELKAIFVARKPELAEAVAALNNTGRQTIAQHLLLVGARGMGKSTLLQRVALEVEEVPALAKEWLPLRFPEEQYTVSTLAQFWANVLGALTDAVERQGKPTDELDNCAAKLALLPINQQEDATLATINQWSDKLKRRLLLLVDNTDMLLANLNKDAHWRLRQTLQHNKRLFWLGGSYQVLEASALYHDAFLDFFHPMELRPLSLAEMQEAIEALAFSFGNGKGLHGKDAAKEIAATLAAHPERLKTLRQLSGGNPRTTVMLYELFVSSTATNVRSDLERLLDMMTPLYKARIESLADVPRKLLAHILEHWAPISLAELAATSQIAKTTISAQLQRLELEGLIEKTKLHGTTRNGYQASERFFNIWYLMRNAPRRLRVRLAWLVEFMRMWYSQSERAGLAKGRLGIALSGEHDQEYNLALAATLPEDADERLQLEWAVLKLQTDQARLSELFDLEDVDQNYKGAADYLKRLRALPTLLRECPHAKTEEEKQRFTQFFMGSPISLEQKELIARTVKWISLEIYEEVLTKLISYPNLRNYFENVSNGNFFPEMQDSKLAFTQITTCFKDDTDVLQMCCNTLQEKYSDVWALKACEFLLITKPDNFNALRWIANIHINMHDKKAAINALNRIFNNISKESINQITILIFDCTNKNQGLYLAELMEASEFREQFQIFVHVLHILAGSNKKLTELPLEVMKIVEDVVQELRDHKSQLNNLQAK